jgi:hypothetical protein
MIFFTTDVKCKHQLLFKIDLPGTDISAISSRALQTGVAVPSSHNASYAAKKEKADSLQRYQQK